MNTTQPHSSKHSCARSSRRRSRNRGKRKHPIMHQVGDNELSGLLAELKEMENDSDEIGSADEDLMRYIEEDEHLKQSFRDAFRRLEDRLPPEAECKAVLWEDYEYPDQQEPTMLVKTPIESVEEYQSIKSTVYTILDEVQQGETMIYADIVRA